jgi:rhodanese-related sulfurtransferase
MLRNFATRPLLLAATRVAMFRNIEYSEIQTISNIVVTKAADPHFFVVDVRTPEEVSNTGIIPGAVNVPLDQFETAFELQTPDAFKKQYGVERPTGGSHTMVVYCHMGGRSVRGAAMAEKLGFEDVLNYSGGMSEWMSHNQK